jgi:putative ABC transport system permease protein
VAWGEAGGGTVGLQGDRRRAERIAEAVRSLPGVLSVATSYSLPGVPDQYQMQLRPVEGRADSELKMLVQAHGVSAAYFTTMRIPLLGGEVCRDEAATATAMVNRRFVDTYYPNASPIGHRFVIPAEPAFPPVEIRGIVADARDGGLDRDPVATVYMCSVRHQPNTFFLVRTTGDPASLVEPIRRRMREVEPLRSVHGARPLVDHIGDTQAERRLRMVLLAFFAVSAISLAAVGLFGTLSYVVNIRRREIALRLALGAGRAAVIGTVAGGCLAVAATGVVGGLALAAGSTRLLAGMLYRVSATDPATVVGVVAIVMMVVVLSCVVPAARAARLDPMRVLRES